MKKLSINIISICIVTITALMTLAPITGFCIGLVAGFNSVADNESDYKYPVSVTLMPDMEILSNPSDTIITQQDEKYPFIPTEGILMLPKKELQGITPLLSVAFPVLSIIVFILFAVAFIRFIIRINKGFIFEQRNVILLRRISILLFLMAALQILTMIIKEIGNSLENISINGFTITYSWQFPWAWLLMAFLALLMAQVWRQGILLQEDQELTI